MGWLAIAAVVVVAFTFGFFLCAILASNSYDREVRDGERTRSEW